MKYFILAVTLAIIGCGSSSISTQTQTFSRDTAIIAPATIAHDTAWLPAIYHGGENTGCDTAAILAAASFSLTKTDTTGRVGVYEYDALKRKFDAISSQPPKTIEVPRVFESTKTVIKQGPGFFEKIEIGSVGAMIMLGFAFIAYGLLKFNIIKL